nr:MAG TPA: dUTPase [Caudoviricetes sp.]
MSIIRNPDTEYVEEIVRKLKENDNYCPCRLKKSSETRCMCKEFREMIKNNIEGYCHCKLYYNKVGENKMEKKIMIKYHCDDIEKITKIKNGDWIDLRSAENVSLKKGEYKLISLGISMKLPDGYEAHIVPRSSTYKKWGIIQTNHMGIIDNSYCGDDDVWMMPVLATRDAFISKNDRICQFRIEKKQPSVQFKTVETLGCKNRGGFGSTGVN